MKTEISGETLAAKSYAAGLFALLILVAPSPEQRMAAVIRRRQRNAEMVAARKVRKDARDARNREREGKRARQAIERETAKTSREERAERIARKREAFLTRKCPRCGTTRPTSEWPRHPAGRIGSHCGLCPNPMAPKPREHHLAVKRANRWRREAPIREANRAAREQRAKERAAAKAVRAAGRQTARVFIGPPVTPIVRYRIKMASDPSYAINQRMRVSIRKAMRGAKAGRRWETLVGYTLTELVANLASRLPDGYTMNDFTGGRLHIDHIIPKWTFDVSTLEGLRACWALPNLQPLVAVDNLRKGRRLDWAPFTGERRSVNVQHQQI